MVIHYGEEDLGTMVLLHDDQSVNGSSKWGIIAPCPTYTPPPTEPCDGGNSSTVYERQHHSMQSEYLLLRSRRDR